MLTIALICVWSFISHVIADCSIPPIYLDIQTREVEGANNALSYGLSINAGTPIQQLSLWPSLETNETTLADPNFCSTSSSSCTASSAHGLFDPSKSSSFTNTPPQSLDNTSNLTGSISTFFSTGTDTVHLYSSLNPDSTPTATNLTHFPLQLLSNYTSPTSPFFGPAGLLGLGSSSALLTSLHSAGKIASRSYGLYIGNAYPRDNATNTNTVNGSLTLGGYDAARFQNPVESFPITSASTSGLSVPVSAIALSDSNPSTNLLSTPFTAHLSTTQYSLTLPSSLTASLSSTSNQPLTLRITLGTNLTLTLPSTYFSTHPIAFSPTGPYILGTSLLQSLYLTVSYDSTPATFFLAPAVPEPGYAAPAALCANEMPTPLDGATLSYFVKNGLVGLIIGVGIAGCAVGVLGVLVGRQCWRGRERRRMRALKGEEGEMEMGYMDRNEKQSKKNQVRVVEKATSGEMAMEEEEHSAMYFAPPPRRATVLVEKRERKMGLKGILKVKVPGGGIQ